MLKYLCDQFPGLSEQKLKEGVFVWSETRKIMKDKNCDKKREKKEKEA